MASTHPIELLVYGGAAVIDTAVLLALLGRRNWPRVSLSFVLLVGSVWLFHCAAFVNAMLAASPADWVVPARGVAKICLAAGLMAQPSAVLHTLWRLHRHGFNPRPRPDWMALVIYTPLLLLAPAANVLLAAPRAPFLVVAEPFIVPYLIWLLVANGAAAAGCSLLKRRFEERGARVFLTSLALALAALVAAEIGGIWLGTSMWPEQRTLLVIVATLAPVALPLVLAHAIVRFRLMALVLRRSAIYGALLVGAILLHRVVLQGIWSDLSERYHLDFVLLEGALLIALVLLFRPLRERAAEALHYLMGEHITRTRKRARELTLEMSSMVGEPSERVLDWFAAALRRTFSVHRCAIWLVGGERKTLQRAGDDVGLGDDAIRELFAALADNGTRMCQRGEAPTVQAEGHLALAEASLAVALRHPSVTALVLLGRRERYRELTEEHLNLISLLVEQLGITLANGMLLAERTRAERAAMQSEKLSMLGLVASSIAHEVKNPLSSIKTIATVMAEDYPVDSEPARDLCLIVEETERLTARVNDILSFARPAREGLERSSPTRAIEGTLQIMRHVARQKSVELETDLGVNVPDVEIEENALREVVFNLMANAITAAGVGGTVSVRQRHHGDSVEIEVHDSGPGIPEELQDSLFEPFVTGREDGTGLGLYVVTRRVQDAGGELRCDSSTDRGTLFTVRLPRAQT